jgi:hypothetical protein
MSAKWLRLESDIVDHPKTGRLEAILNEPLAGWYVIRALSWMSRFCPTGHVRDNDGTSLESSAKWRGTSGELLAALVSCGWLDVVSGGWEWHDWAEHQGKVAYAAAKERARKAAYRSKRPANVPADVPRDNDGTTTGRPAQRDVTGRDVTGRDVTGREKKQQDVEQAQPKALMVKPMAVRPDNLTDDEWNVFEHWRQKTGKSSAMLSAERLTLIRRWLATPGVTVERLQRAIDGCCKTPWNRGDNPERKKYLELTLILRNAETLERFEGAAS